MSMDFRKSGWTPETKKSKFFYCLVKVGFKFTSIVSVKRGRIRMKKMSSRSKLLSQVFLKERSLVTSLVKRSSIGSEDTVLEIGPGKGIITDELLRHARRVIAVEKDPRLFHELIQRYQGNASIKIYNADILRFKLPDFEYKVFSNIPFAIEGQLVRNLIDHPHNPPVDTYLIMRRKVVRRLAGIPKEGQFSILHKPWFQLEIFHNFGRDDFIPKPKVESSMFRFKKREEPLVDPQHRRLYELFVKQGFGGGRRLRQNMQPIFTKNQLNRLAGDFGFRLDNMPSQLSFKQWLGMFEFFLQGISEDQRRKFVQRSGGFKLARVF